MRARLLTDDRRLDEIIDLTDDERTPDDHDDRTDEQALIAERERLEDLEERERNPYERHTDHWHERYEERQDTPDERCLDAEQIVRRHEQEHLYERRDDRTANDEIHVRTHTAEVRIEQMSVILGEQVMAYVTNELLDRAVIAQEEEREEGEYEELQAQIEHVEQDPIEIADHSIGEVDHRTTEVVLKVMAFDELGEVFRQLHRLKRLREAHACGSNDGLHLSDEQEPREDQGYDHEERDDREHDGR